MLETVYVCDSFDVLVTDLLYTSLYSWSIVHIQKVSSMSEKVTYRLQPNDSATNMFKLSPS